MYVEDTRHKVRYLNKGAGYSGLGRVCRLPPGVGFRVWDLKLGLWDSVPVQAPIILLQSTLLVQVFSYRGAKQGLRNLTHVLADC